MYMLRIRVAAQARGEGMPKKKAAPVGPVETVEEFLARGGKIQKIAYGERSYDSEQPGNRWGKGRKKKAAPKTKPTK